MKNLLVAINAKYIHPNLAVRLLKKNTNYHADIIEFTIKDKSDSIISYILDNGYTTIAFSCYIWNIVLIKEILLELKNKKLTIILGGPEVSYNANFYLNNDLCDYVIKNEGEESYDYLLSYLDNKCQLNDIPNLYYKNGYTFDKLVDLNKTKMAYDLLPDVQNKIMYIETSRGCPYKCSYCMASLDNKVRFFNIEEIKTQILNLLNKGAKIFKFLDRTFNANKKNFLTLVDFIIKNHTSSSSFQFEITGDILEKDIINYINNNSPRNLFRFEIGIQSTNEATNLAVNRFQDNEKLFTNILLIQEANIIDLHLDLIAGLPKEDYLTFKQTFNDVIKLRPKELQLGFLKMLYGTSLLSNASKYGYEWSKQAPYEIIKNDYLNIKDIANIKIVEDVLDKYYNTNYMKQSINLILDNVDNYFDFFYYFGLYYIKNKKNNLSNLFKILDDYLYVTNFSKYETVHISLITNYLEYYKIKPDVWWDNKTSPKEKNRILRSLLEKELLAVPIDVAYKYSMVILYKSTVIVVIYLPDKRIINTYYDFTIDKVNL